ncbi:2-hydroxyacid dehydrogenase [Neoroseomonas lacus]|uniref:D-isomer specific 2-hydroxyacid dehydrogenase n=1 Tax=Neoroseomonas lacus TaxID=287609 RepID=A0A917KSS7_9PROT|nr:2-hydroxyacid dehydrogenase [Neoroseomonas lacus]GGJ26063.1 D-isomer specific 2-hydroxyacid dehydrogenase [Neoroseomonas lacus]
MTETVLLLSAIPADLRAALAARYTLVEDKPAEAPRPGIRIAVTMALAGATEAQFARLPDLRLLSSQGAGLERIDLAAAARRGIAVAYTPDVMTEDVADAAIGLMYAAARRVAEADRFVRAGRWAQERMGLGISLHRKAAGIVGLGRIGQAIARRCAGLGMDVAWTGPRPKPDQPWPFLADIRALAERSDVLILATPGGGGTDRLVDAGVLAALGPRGVLVNIARGSVVDEEALIVALQDGTIAAAGLDVFAREPALDARFLALDNVVLAPHSASLTIETRAALVARILADMDAFRDGRAFLDAASGAV